MKNWQEKNYTIQISMFFLTAFGVVLMCLSTSFAFFAFLDTLSKIQSLSKVSSVQAIEISSKHPVKSDIKYQSKQDDRTAELAIWQAEQVSMRFKNQSLRGSLTQHQKNLIHTLTQTKAWPPKHAKSPSITRFKSSRS